MSRSVITRPATLRRLSEIVGRPIVRGLARGNNGHMVYAIEADRSMWCVWPDGTFERSEYTAGEWDDAQSDTAGTPVADVQVLGVRVCQDVVAGVSAHGEGCAAVGAEPGRCDCGALFRAEIQDKLSVAHHATAPMVLRQCEEFLVDLLNKELEARMQRQDLAFEALRAELASTKEKLEAAVILLAKDPA